MSTPENFSEKDSLLLITDMINKTKQSFHNTGFGPIMWGCVIIICSLYTFCQFQFQLHWNIDIWLLTIFAIVPQIIFSYKESKMKKVETYNDIAMDYTWISFGISIFLLIFWVNVFDLHMRKEMVDFQNSKGTFSLNNHGTTLYLMLYGIPTFITGGIMKFKPMLYGGILFWIFSLISNYTDIKIDMLLMATSALIGWLIPGIILNNRYRKAKLVNV